MKPENEKLTSLQAAALWLSDGATDDPALAVDYDQGAELNIDNLQKAALRRMMGFDFDLQIMPRVILVTARDGSLLRTRCKINPGDMIETPNGPMIANEQTIIRLVAACSKLKRQWDDKQRVR